MNWKNRLLNKTTLLSLIGVCIYFVFTLAKLFGYEPDAEQYREMYDLLACVILGLAILGIITDPNTPGITDGGSHKSDNYEDKFIENLNKHFDENAKG